MTAHGLTPIPNVSDLDASFAWFESFGWRKLWAYGEPPDFGAVGSGPCEIFLSLDGQGGRAEPGTRGWGMWMTVWVEDVDEVHRMCLERGLDVTQPPTDEPWGVRELHVRHPDGHTFRVSRGIPHDHDHSHDHDHDHDHPHPH